jgi:WASH complex subunit FAM21
MNKSAELLKETSSWNLGSDQKLLAALQTFSSSLGEKTKTLIGRVDDLNSDASEVECKLRNTFNDFLMLADTQFIENVSKP